MLTMVKKFEFEAAHRLPKHEGACQRMHGHRYELEVGISGPINMDTGMIADFKQLKDVVKTWVVDVLDHQYMNEVDVPGFPRACPTAEKMVIWIVDVLKTALAKTGCELNLVRLWETSGSRVEWSR